MYPPIKTCQQKRASELSWLMEKNENPSPKTTTPVPQRPPVVFKSSSTKGKAADGVSSTIRTLNSREKEQENLLLNASNVTGQLYLSEFCRTKMLSVAASVGSSIIVEQ